MFAPFENFKAKSSASKKTSSAQKSNTTATTAQKSATTTKKSKTPSKKEKEVEEEDVDEVDEVVEDVDVKVDGKTKNDKLREESNLMGLIVAACVFGFIFLVIIMTVGYNEYMKSKGNNGIIEMSNVENPITSNLSGGMLRLKRHFR